MKTQALRSALVIGIAAVLATLVFTLPGRSEERVPYRSPFDVAFSPDGRSIAVSDRTAGECVIFDVETRAPRLRVELLGRPSGVSWRGKREVLVAEYGNGTVAAIDAASGRVRRRFDVGPRPLGVRAARSRGLLIAANTTSDDVSLIDVETGSERARVRVPREPYFIECSPDASVAIVGNLLPAGSGDDAGLAAAVSLIDLERGAKIADIALPEGSTAVREIAISPDGRWAYVVHTIGRFRVPTTQLDRGWVNTNALSILDLHERVRDTTVLLDRLYSGSTDPWGLALSPDGRTLWISLRGVHEVMEVDVGSLRGLLDGEGPGALLADGVYPSGTRGIWSEVASGREGRRALENDLSALDVAGLARRVALPGSGPRGIDVSPDGATLAVALYFSGELALIDARRRRVVTTVKLGASREPDSARRGERLFHDATLCFQRWLSCSTCHPDEGRTDGLRWDLLNDGLGTPQRTRSLLMSHRIAPTTARGVRANRRASVSKGMSFFAHESDPALEEALVAYIGSLEPEPSPFLVDGALAPAATRGRAHFNGKARCAHCHSGELGTDLKAHDVGVGERFYTSKLIELYRTAPYLHDGRAATLESIFTEHDPENEHGDASRLTPAEFAELMAYLRSL